MTSQLVIGIFVGLTIFGVLAGSYFFIRILENATTAIRELNNTLKPIFQNDEVIKGFRMLNGITIIASDIGSRMDALNSTLKLFTSTVFSEAPKSSPASEGGVYAYDEESAAVNEAAAHLRKHGIEIERDPKRVVSASTDDEVPPPF